MGVSGGMYLLVLLDGKLSLLWGSKRLCEVKVSVCSRITTGTWTEVCTYSLV